MVSRNSPQVAWLQNKFLEKYISQKSLDEAFETVSHTLDTSLHLMVGFSGRGCLPSCVRKRYYSMSCMIFTLFSLVSQHSWRVLLPLRQLHGNRLGDVHAGAGLFPQNVFRLCRPGNPHRTHLGSRIRTQRVLERTLIFLLCCVDSVFFFITFDFPNSPISFWNTLIWGRPPPWSSAWWSSLRTCPTAWLKASSCLVCFTYTHTCLCT